MSEESSQPKRIGDYLVAGRDYPLKMKLVDLAGIDLELTGVAISAQDGRQYLIVTANLDGAKIVFAAGGQVTMPKLMALVPHLPVVVQFYKDGRAWDVR